ncbi:hypothetical protein OAM69_06055 [bacterium]|nr:hypothetical protein [bacterium]
MQRNSGAQATHETPDEVDLQNADVVDIAILHLSGYEHSCAFDDVIETLYCGFCRLGYLTKIERNFLIDDGLNIALGAHLLSDDDLE